MRAGIAIKPKTDVSVLYDILDNEDKDAVPDVSRYNFGGSGMGTLSGS